MKSAIGVAPLFDRVYVRRLKSKTKTKGGIFIAEVAQNPPNYGQVVAIGPTIKSPDYLKTGDGSGSLVMFGQYSGTDIVINDEPFVMLREEEIIGVVDDADLAKTLVETGA